MIFKDSSQHTIATKCLKNIEKAITCLTLRYDRPPLIHQAHVQKILEIPSLKDGSGGELRRLHNVAQQHFQALKALGQEPSGSFVRSLLELKLDTNNMFEWQRHSQSSTDIPHYKDMLEFINLRVQASETLLPDTGRKSFKTDYASSSKKTMPSKSVASFTASTDTSSNCVVCKYANTHSMLVPGLNLLITVAKCRLRNLTICA